MLANSESSSRPAHHGDPRLDGHAHRPERPPVLGAAQLVALDGGPPVGESDDGVGGIAGDEKALAGREAPHVDRAPQQADHDGGVRALEPAAHEGGLERLATPERGLRRHGGRGRLVRGRGDGQGRSRIDGARRPGQHDREAEGAAGENPEGNSHRRGHHTPRGGFRQALCPALVSERLTWRVVCINIPINE
jgi:hypothetical protein